MLGNMLKGDFYGFLEPFAPIIDGVEFTEQQIDAFNVSPMFLNFFSLPVFPLNLNKLLMLLFYSEWELEYRQKLCDWNELSRAVFSFSDDPISDVVRGTLVKHDLLYLHLLII